MAGQLPPGMPPLLQARLASGCRAMPSQRAPGLKKFNLERQYPPALRDPLRVQISSERFSEVLRGFQSFLRGFQRFFRGFQRSSQRPSQSADFLSEALSLVAPNRVAP